MTTSQLPKARSIPSVNFLIRHIIQLKLQFQGTFSISSFNGTKLIIRSEEKYLFKIRFKVRSFTWYSKNFNKWIKIIPAETIPQVLIKSIS